MLKKILFTIIFLSFLTLLRPEPSHAQYCGTNCPPGVTCVPAESCGAVGCTVGYSAPYSTCGGANPNRITRPQSAAENYIAGNQPCGGITGYAVCSFINIGLGDPETGAVRASLNAIATLYENKPAETAIAIRQFKQAMRLPVKEAYAQSGGFGFNSLMPILGLWQLSRNVALAGFVFIFVAIGFMIMLRKQIDPRTVVTIQQALPKVIISLILVVFSYAICGAYIDIMMLGTRTGLVLLRDAGLIAQGNNLIDPPLLRSDENPLNDNVTVLLNRNIFELFDGLYNADVIIDSLTSLRESTLYQTDRFDTVANLLRLNGDDESINHNGILGVVLWIAVFLAMLRTFIMLLTAYLTVTLKIIFSPFSFLLMALPGSESSFGSWTRGIFKHLLVFPVVFFMLSFAAIFGSVRGSALWVDSPGERGTGNYWNVSDNDGRGFTEGGIFSTGGDGRIPYWSAPALGNWGLAVGPLLSFGIIMTIPKASAMISENLTPKSRPSAAEGAAGAAFKEAAGRTPVIGSLFR
jgi:hypothetical protein